MTEREIELFLDNIQERLRQLVRTRPFRFEKTRRADAEEYLRCLTAFEGMSDAEIAGLESQLGAHFPLTFKKFLLRFGADHGDLFCGSDAEPHKIPEYKQWATELIAENGAPNFLPDNAVVFHFHQGYIFCYLIAEGQVDSPVYVYRENQEAPKIAFESFLAFLDHEVKVMETVQEQTSKGGGYFIRIEGSSVTQVWDSRRAIDRDDQYE